MLNFIKFLSFLLMFIFSFHQAALSKNLSIYKMIFKDVEGYK